MGYPKLERGADRADTLGGEIMFKRLTALLLGASLLVLPSHAEETLTFATASPPQGPISTVIFDGWAQRINADGEGIVEIDVQHGFTVASPANFYDRVKDGVVPISWGIMTTVGGRFPLTSVVELPNMPATGEAASVAFWRLYAEGHLDAEYHDIVPLFLTAFPQSGIHLSKPLASLDDLGGARVIAGSQTNSAVVQALGGVPQSINPADAYEAIQRGTADGRLVPWSAFPPFRMEEITSYHIEAPVGTAVGMVFINRSVWEGLSEEAREIIMRHSGEEQTRLLGQFFDQQEAGIRGGLVATGGHEVVSPDTTQAVQWIARLEPVVADWLARTEGGGAVLDRYSALLAEARN
jgi:TRAP-type C4-dicarboxylate transport system substrate-binding protein